MGRAEARGTEVRGKKRPGQMGGGVSAKDKRQGRIAGGETPVEKQGHEMESPIPSQDHST